MSDRADLFPEGDAYYITPGGGVLRVGAEGGPMVLDTKGEWQMTDINHLYESRASHREEAMEFYTVWRDRDFRACAGREGTR